MTTTSAAADELLYAEVVVDGTPVDTSVLPEDRKQSYARSVTTTNADVVPLQLPLPAECARPCTRAAVVFVSALTQSDTDL